MEYITVKQASKLWGIDVSRIGKLIRSGKIAGVAKVGGHYLIASGTPKPIDGRTTSRTKGGKSENFRFPSFAFQDLSSYYPPLSQEELCLKNVEEQFLACNYKKADETLLDLPEKAQDKYCKIYALYAGCLIDIEINNVNRFFDRYNKLLLELQSEFLYKKEMSCLVYEIEITLGHIKHFNDEFIIDAPYNYHPSFLPHLAHLCAMSLYCNVEHTKKEDINFFEMTCKLLENTTNYYELQSLYAFLSSTFAVIKEYDKMTFYFKKALDMAQKYNCYYTVASLYYYFKDLLKPAFNGYDDKLKEKIEFFGNDMQKRFIEFSNNVSLNSIYEKLSHREYILILYAVQGYTNKEIASILNVSEISIAKQYSDLYADTGATKKSDLIDLYNKSINKSIFDK